MRPPPASPACPGDDPAPVVEEVGERPVEVDPGGPTDLARDARRLPTMTGVSFGRRSDGSVRTSIGTRAMRQEPLEDVAHA